SPGGSQRDDIRRYVMRSVRDVSYLPGSVTKEFPLQRLPDDLIRKRVRGREAPRTREAPNNVGEVASFLTGCARALAKPPKTALSAGDVLPRVRRALADKLGIVG